MRPAAVNEAGMTSSRVASIATGLLSFTCMAGLSACGGSGDAAVRCGAGTELRGGACEVATAPPVPTVEDGGITVSTDDPPSPFAAGCTTLRLVARTPLSGAVAPRVLPLDDGSGIIVHEGSGVFAQAIDAGGRMRGEKRAVADHRGTPSTVRLLAPAALPGARVALRWAASEGPTSASGAVAVLGGDLTTRARLDLPGDGFSPFAATSTKAGLFRVLGTRWEDGRTKVLVVDHDAAAVVTGTHEVRLDPGVTLDPNAVALVPSEDGGTILVAALSPASGTGRDLTLVPIDASGIPGTAVHVASPATVFPFRVVTTGDDLLVAVGSGAVGAGGAARATLDVELLAIGLRPTLARTARTLATVTFPIAQRFAPQVRLVWAGSRGFLVTRGTALAAHALDRAGAVGPEQLLLDAGDLVDLDVGATRDALAFAWVAGTGEARTSELATFGCAP